MTTSPPFPPAEPPAAPFRSSIEHLLAELHRADGLVREAARRARALAPDEGEMKGLYISDAEVDALAGEALGVPPWAEPAEHHLAAAIDERARASERAGVELRLERLRRAFALSRFEIDILLIALLPDLDLRPGRLIGYLHDDLTRRRPSVDLLLGLLCPSFEARLAARARFSPAAPLLRHGLIEVFTDTPAQRPPLLAQMVKVDERIVAYLHGSDELDPALAPYARVARPPEGELLVPAELRQRLLRFTAGGDAIVYLEGPRGAGKEALAASVCHARPAPMIVADGPGLAAAGSDPPRALLAALTREAQLTGAALYIGGADELLDEAHPARNSSLLEALRDHRGLVFLAGRGAWPGAALPEGRPFVRVIVPLPGAAARAQIWKAALGEDRALGPDLDLDAIAGTYRMSGGQIQAAAAAARDLARFRDPEGGPIALADLLAAQRAQHPRGHGALARRIEPTQGWSDLVLPPDREQVLRELCAHVRHRSRVYDAWGFERKLSTGRGLGVLFSGPPGTGKTLAAGVIAAELGLELLHIDLSAVVSKYIGETEKHLSRLFDDAEATSAILFFDEADAIFGKRTEVKDAHDRYANVETSYLLQRIDAYEGMVILASNLTKNMDEAFVRRLRFILDFPSPGEAERRRIWERMLPAEAPLGPDIDLALLARRFDVPGGPIRNIALLAAFLAADEGTALGMRHLLRAARREYEKMGKMVDAEHFSLRVPRAS